MEPKSTVIHSTKQVMVIIPAGWSVIVNTIPGDLQAIKGAFYDTGDCYIASIRQVRALLDSGLKEAKEIVDDWREELRRGTK